MSRPRAAISWSGGKDSCAALLRARASYHVASMVTMFDEGGLRSRSHGLRPEVLAAQADRLGLQRVTGRCSWDTYDRAFSQALDTLAAEGTTHVIFGDILFEEHRRWAERLCAGSGLTAVEPLWGTSTDLLFDEWVASNSHAVIVTTRANLLDETWLGRRLGPEMRPEFDRLGIDPCGERGEYHTAVLDTPLFSSPLCVRENGRVRRSDCWALDLRPC
jgi:uncharacterized protein (TIGR00290 family)